jgi:hypothetical protein
MYTKKVDLFSARFVQRTDMKVSENILKILFKNSILACLSLVKNVLIYSKSRVIHLIITELVAKDEVTRLLQLNAEYSYYYLPLVFYPKYYTNVNRRTSDHSWLILKCMAATWLCKK